MNATLPLSVGPLALFGDVGGGEMLVVLAAVLLLFGGRRLPGIARSLGKMSADLRRQADDFKAQLMQADRESHPDSESRTGLPEDEPPATPAGTPAPQRDTAPSENPAKEPAHDRAG